METKEIVAIHYINEGSPEHTSAHFMLTPTKHIIVEDIVASVYAHKTKQQFGRLLETPGLLYNLLGTTIATKIATKLVHYYRVL